MLQVSRLILALVLAVGLFACSSEDDGGGADTRESRLNEATALIDKGDYDSAIAMLEDLRKSDPSEKVSIVLASAYAGRAGMKVEKYWGFVVTYKPLFKNGHEDTAEISPVLDLAALPDSTSPEVRDLLRSLNDHLREFMKIRRRVEQIPHASRESRFDLQRGVDVLDGVPTRGAHLYRAILEVILLRSAVDEAVNLASSLLSDSARDVCDLKARRLVEWVRYAQGTLKGALGDLIEAYPDDRDELGRYRQVVDSFEIPSTEQACGSAF